MSPSRPTLSVADALGLKVDAGPLDALAGRMTASLTEWSVNPAGDGRGRLRATLWTENPEVGPLDFLPRAAAETAKALPAAGMSGFGFAWGGVRTLRRWYRLAPPAAGGDLAKAAAIAIPQLAAAIDQLAANLGGWAQCTGIGLEVDGTDTRRATVYFRVSDPLSLLRLLHQAGVDASARAQLLVRGIMGLDPQRTRPWPHTWIARSTGDEVGWKLYYFARRDPWRAPDEALLDAIDAPADLRLARDRLAELLPSRPPKAGFPHGMVQLLALRLGGSTEPPWTVYLGPR